MADPRRDEDPLLTELDAWTQIITSSGWKHFIALMRRHQAWLQKEVNQCVKTGNQRGADRAQAKMEDVQNIINLIQKRVDELNRKKEVK